MVMWQPNNKKNFTSELGPFLCWDKVQSSKSWSWKTEYQNCQCYRILRINTKRQWVEVHAITVVIRRSDHKFYLTSHATSVDYAQPTGVSCVLPHSSIIITAYGHWVPDNIPDGPWLESTETADRKAPPPGRIADWPSTNCSGESIADTTIRNRICPAPTVRPEYHSDWTCSACTCSTSGSRTGGATDGYDASNYRTS